MAPVNEALFVLASQSATRATMLARAGLQFSCDAANIDEASLMARCQTVPLDAATAAIALATAKASVVAGRHPQTLVLGADQLLECDGRWLVKARCRDEARDALFALRGRSHRLVTAAAVVRDHTVLWLTVDTATLTMRAFDDEFVERYLDAIGDAALSSVGAYQIEGPGAQLFARVDGNHFTILGLPLLPFLAFLRRVAPRPVP